MFCDQTVCGETAVFTTSSNLRILCAFAVLLMDGKFKSCPRYFAQCTVSGALDTYSPLVCALLSNKCMTDTDDVALSDLQVAVLLILHLRFC